MKPNSVKIIGNVFDVGCAPAQIPKNVEIKLNKRLVLYENNAQIVGDAMLAPVAEDGSWEHNVVDTDGMETDVHYIFKIAGQTFKRFVPDSLPQAEFNNLPSIFS